MGQNIEVGKVYKSHYFSKKTFVRALGSIFTHNLQRKFLAVNLQTGKEMLCVIHYFNESSLLEAREYIQTLEAK